MSISEQDYAKLSLEVYGGTEPAGWKMLEGISYASGMYAAAYRNLSTGEVVIAYRGTEPLTGLYDDLLGADKAIVLDGEHQQFIDALEFAKRVDERSKREGFHVTVTGHSLGGALAQLAADVFGWGGVTFDAPGVARLTDNQQFQTWFAQNPGLGFGNVIGLMNYVIEGSLISGYTGPHIGSTTPIEGADSGAGSVAIARTAKITVASLPARKALAA